MHTIPSSGVLISARSGFYLGFVLPFGGREAGRQQEYLAAAGLELWFPTFLAVHSPAGHAQPTPPLPHLRTALSPLNTTHWARPLSAVSPRHLDTRFFPSLRRGLSMEREGERETGIGNESVFSLAQVLGVGKLEPLSPALIRTPSPAPQPDPQGLHDLNLGLLDLKARPFDPCTPFPQPPQSAEHTFSLVPGT